MRCPRRGAPTLLLLRFGNGGDAIEVEGAEGGPGVVGEGRSGDGEGGFGTVQEAFDEDVGILGAAVEDQLDVRSLGGLPVLVTVLHFVGILGIEVGAVQAHQDGHGADVGVMAEAEVGDAVAGAIQDGIGFLQEVLQDMPL